MNDTPQPLSGTTPAPTHDGHRPGSAVLPKAPDVASALSSAALVALHAPSVHNTQPWHWRVGTERLELYADERWRLAVADPEGRLQVVSCGAALHHARVALRAMGYLPAVRRFPNQARPDLLASVTVGKPIPVSEHSRQLMDALLRRQTDRRGITDIAIPEDTLAALREAAGSEGAWLHLLTADQAFSVIAAAQRAENEELADPAYRDELGRWTERADDATDGIPAATLSPRGNVFSTAGRYALLYGSGDRPTAWLRAGEALSAVWLTATARGLVVQPISSVIEIPAARSLLHQMLSGIGCPYLLLRMGVPTHTNVVPMTPRRPADESIGMLGDKPDPVS